MLVTTFAIAFLLQAIALIVDLRDGTTRGGRALAHLAERSRSRSHGADIRKITLVSVAVAARRDCSLLALLLTRDDDRPAHARRGQRLPHGPAARRAREPRDRVLGRPVRPARRVVAVMMTVQLPLVTPDFALHDTIIVLVGVVVGGIDRLWTATLGGFAIGFASGVINGVLPTDKTVYLPSASSRSSSSSCCCGRRDSSPGAAGRPSSAYDALRSTPLVELLGAAAARRSRSASSRPPPRSRTRSTS